MLFAELRSTTGESMLHVRNIFNFASWADMLDTLENCFYVPEYVLRILRNYLRKRSLFYKLLEGQRKIETMSRVAQLILGIRE